PGPGTGGSAAVGAKTRGGGCAERSRVSEFVRACQLAEVVVRDGGRRGHVKSVVVVELEFLLRGGVTAHAEIGGVLHERAVEGNAQGALDQLARLERDEGVP